MNQPKWRSAQALAQRHQQLLQRAQQERVALAQAAAGLRRPLHWLAHVSPWLALGWQVARWRQQRKT